MLEIPNLNVVYEDDTTTLYLHDVHNDGSLLVMHAVVIPTTNREILAHYAEIVYTIFHALKARGVQVVEAWVNTDVEIRYAQFFGFELTGDEIVVEGFIHPPVYRMVKVL